MNWRLEREGYKKKKNEILQYICQLSRLLFEKTERQTRSNQFHTSKVYREAILNEINMDWIIKWYKMTHLEVQIQTLGEIESI